MILNTDNVWFKEIAFVFQFSYFRFFYLFICRKNTGLSRHSDVLLFIRYFKSDSTTLSYHTIVLKNFFKLFFFLNKRYIVQIKIKQKWGIISYFCLKINNQKNYTIHGYLKVFIAIKCAWLQEITCMDTITIDTQ